MRVVAVLFTAVSYAKSSKKHMCVFFIEKDNRDSLSTFSQRNKKKPILGGQQI